MISSCSTKKNTWTSRTYQEATTRFNVFFNGELSFEEGLQSIQKANKEDFSSVLPMYPISNHANASSATSSMERTMEKCRKAIKLHSIKVKPAKNEKKASQPKYILFYNQEEFNPALRNAWMLLAQSEFYKGEFLASSSTFAYIARHYANDKDMVAQCQLWIVRSYAEMGWIYEAEQVLSQLQQDNLKRENIGLFAAVNADLLLKKHLYAEAIPFLELALDKEKEKYSKIRFTYILAQLYQLTNNNKKAYEYYQKVIEVNPPYEMEFNAQISIAQLNIGSVVAVRKVLTKMLKNPNNKNYLDQLYTAIGNTFLAKEDTAAAIVNYKLGIEKSKRNGIDKAQTFIKLGDIYYLQKNYKLAQPCYEGASKIISKEHSEYFRIKKRAELLGELVVQANIVTLQDSLQKLATLPESKQLELVNKIIENLKEAEKLAANKKKINSENNGSIDDLPNMGGMGDRSGGAANWYFYNTDLIKNGQQEFEKKWGQRSLEDSWRRANKAAALFAEEKKEGAITKDSTDSTLKVGVDDNKSPKFYLRQIPNTEAKIKKSNAEIADALFLMGQIYKDKINDYPQSVVAFEEFIRRFGDDKRVPDAYYQLYMLEVRRERTAEAEGYKAKLINGYPDSKYYKILSQPDYANGLSMMYKVQDSIYQIAYDSYNKSDYTKVFQLTEQFKQNYPLSSIMPKILFLNALSIGKKESPDKFKVSLNELVKSYPESDVSARAKDILALMKQGMEAKKGTSSGTLLNRRSELTEAEEKQAPSRQFSSDKQIKHRLLLISLSKEPDMNKLLYNLATYNFSNFLIKNFDMVTSKLDSLSTLSITGLESYDEAKWYEKTVSSDEAVKQLFLQYQIQKVIISEENYGLIKGPFNLDDYLTFQIKEQINGKPGRPVQKKGKEILKN